MSFFASPFWASLADRHNKHVQVFTTTLVGSLVFRALYLYVTTFWKCVVLVAATEFLCSGQGPMVDNGVISAMPDPSEWGKHRLWGAVGFGLAVLAMGYVIEKKESFTVMFVIHIAGMLLSMVMVRTLIKLGPKKLETESSSSSTGSSSSSSTSNGELSQTVSSETLDGDLAQGNGNGGGVGVADGPNDNDIEDEGEDDDGDGDGDGDWDEDDQRRQSRDAEHAQMPDTSTSQLALLKYLLKDWSRCRFFFVVLISGSFTGVIENFLFLYLEQELGASKTLIGLSRFVTCFCEVPMFWIAG